MVDALLAAALNPNAYGGVFNLGAPERVSLKDVAALMVDLYSDGTFELTPFPNDRKAIDIGDYYSDFTNAQTELPWTPKVNLRAGLERTMAFYRLHHSHYWDVK